LAGRDGRGAEQKVLGAAPIWTFRGLAVPTTFAKEQENDPHSERNLRVCRTFLP
jgi:hypothetical protein